MSLPSSPSSVFHLRGEDTHCACPYSTSTLHPGGMCSLTSTNKASWSPASSMATQLQTTFPHFLCSLTCHVISLSQRTRAGVTCQLAGLSVKTPPAPFPGRKWTWQTLRSDTHTRTTPGVSPRQQGPGPLTTLGGRAALPDWTAASGLWLKPLHLNLSTRHSSLCPNRCNHNSRVSTWT